MASLRMMARSFSTSSSQLQQAAAALVRPPIPVFGIEGRYASALFSAASKEKQLDHVEKDVRALGDFFKSNKKLAEALKSPTATKQEKRQMLQMIAKEHQISELTFNAFAAMAEHGRLGAIPKFLKTFGDIMSAARGEILVSVTTARELDGSQRKELMEALKKFAKGDQVLKVDTAVDPSVIGGMVVSIGDKFVDMSTRSKIKMYSKIVEESV